MRPAVPDDIAAIHSIYAHHVLNGFASFEEVPSAPYELRPRYEDISAPVLPYLVAEFGGIVGGYRYCSLYRTRSAYRYSLEDSVYVRSDMQGRGVGTALLDELIRRCEGLDYRQLIAVIGDSANVASIALHASRGFLRVGTIRSAGFKFGRWVDSVIMQRPLGSGDATPPGK